MKQLALFAIVFAMAAQAQATSFQIHVTCQPKEDNMSCIDRAVKSSLAMKLNFHTDSKKMAPDGKETITSKAPTVVLMAQQGEGDSILESYLAIYPVAPGPGSVLKAAAFTVPMESQVEEVNGKAQVTYRSINFRDITLVGESANQ